jgi:hypothetical protein
VCDVLWTLFAGPLILIPDAIVVGCADHAVRLTKRLEYAPDVFAYEAPGR